MRGGLARLATFVVLAPVLTAGCGGSGGDPASGGPRPLVEMLRPADGEGALVEWAFRGARLVTLAGDVTPLVAPPNAAYFSGLAPLVTASASGRRVAYSTGLRAGSLRVRVRDLRTGRDTVLGTGTTGAAWRADGALAYLRGAERALRLRGHLYVRTFDGDRMGAPVRWTAGEGKYVPFGWAGGRLVVARIGEGEYTETLVADAPGRTRTLAGGTPIAISPDGTRVLVFAGGDGSGRDLLLMDLATGRTVSRLRTGVLRSGDWRRDLAVAAGNDGLVVLRIRGDRITLVKRIPLPGRSTAEPRFTGTGLRRVVVSTERGEGAETAPGVCVVATGRCAFAAATRGLEHQHVVYGHTVAAPTLPPLRDGRHLGFIRSLEARGDAVTAVVDPAEWLTGAAAARAARADHGEVANGSYIRNEDRSTAPVTVAPDAAVTIVTPDAIAGTPGTLRQLIGTFAGGLPGGTFHQGPGATYRLTVRGGTVVAIEEQYTP